MAARIIFHIEGMTCSGCETRIENALGKLEGVIEVEVSYTQGRAQVVYDNDKLDTQAMKACIEKQGYQVTEKHDDRSKTVGIGLLVLALYLLIKHTIGFNFIPEINESMSYGLLFLVGLITSLHCVAMCGGINLSVCMRYPKDDPEASGLARLKPSLLYNGGRVLSYTLVGGLVGTLGSVISFSGMAKGIVAVIAGLFMVIMGLNMLDLFPVLKKLNPRLPKILGIKVRGRVNRNSPLVIGFLNGLMPCGPLQAMQLYALGTGSFFGGAISMFLFSIGTVPLMFGVGALSGLASGKMPHRIMKAGGVLVMALGLLMLNRGLILSGLGVDTGSVGGKEAGIARIKDGVQWVTTDLEPGSYSPIVVEKGLPVKWIIRVEKGDLNGCNNPLTIPQLNRKEVLEEGDNLIEFTPEEEGDMIYTCWMGMISSRIRVVEDITQVSPE